MAEGPRGDRRWTAILAIDMADFTAISRRIGPERVYGLLDRTLGLARAAIEAHGGHVVDTAGDGILAAFGAPSALENAPLQSCLAALDFRDRLADALPGLERDFGLRPAFRAGIGGGDTMVARLDAATIKVVGDPVNKAARLQALAAPGEIVISETIRRESEGHLRTTDRGHVEIKGFAEPLRIHSLHGLEETLSRFDGSQRRGLTAMISRRAELDAALGALSGAPPRRVILAGPPGIGKSRLAHEIGAVAERDGPVYVGQCATNAQATAYGPVFDILRQAGGAPWGADRAETLAAFFGRHPDLHDKNAAAQVLGDDSRQRDRSERALQVRAYLADLLRGLSARETCLFVIEDAHWIDTATNALLSALAATPMRMVVTTRPGFRADWFDADDVLRIPLSPLSEPEIAALAEATLGRALSPDLAALIAAKAEGVPLMAEEITRALRHSDRLRDGEDGLVLSGGEGSLLTGNLEQLVLSRVDMLAADRKAGLQTAAAIGRDFSEVLLTAALGRDAELAGIAQQPGLIERVGPGRWRFAHALIRDAIYGGLLTEPRETAHLRIAEAIDASPQRAENWGLQADHFLRSRTPDRAVPHLVRAAGQSLAVSALFDVDERLETAMRFLDADPTLVDETMFAELAVTWLRALQQIGDFGRMIAVSARVLPRLERAGYSPALSIVRTLTATALAHARDYGRAREQALSVLADAEAEGDAWGAAWAKVALMRIYDETRQEGLETLERLAGEILPVAETTEDSQLGTLSLYLLSSAYRNAGRRLKALAVADRISDYAVTHNDRRARGLGRWARALVYSVEGDPERAYEVIRDAREDAIPGGADERVVIGLQYLCHVFFSPPDEMRGKLRNLADEGRALKDFNIAHSVDWISAVLELKAGNLAAGWRRLDDFIVDAERAGNISLVAQGYLTRGEVLMTLAGLIDPRAEAPPTRPDHGAKRPGLGDLATFLALRPRALRNARAALETCLALPGRPNAMRCQIGLGMIAAARGERERALGLLNDGLAAARAEAFPLLIARAERALARLG